MSNLPYPSKSNANPSLNSPAYHVRPSIACIPSWVLDTPPHELGWVIMHVFFIKVSVCCFMTPLLYNDLILPFLICNQGDRITIVVKLFQLEHKEENQVKDQPFQNLLQLKFSKVLFLREGLPPPHSINNDIQLKLEMQAIRNKPFLYPHFQKT